MSRTLVGEEVFGYLRALKEDIAKAAKFNDGLQGMAHRQLYDVLETEEKFLQTYHTEPQLAIAPNGLPTTETLTADLEKICELEEFKDISEKYQKPSNNTNEAGPTYETLDKTEWEKQRNSQKNLTTKTRFKINEREGRLELTLTENSYAGGYDEYSQKYPVLIREGTTRYRVEFGILIPEIQEKYKTVNRALTARNEQALGKITVSNLEVAGSMAKDTYKLGRDLFNFTYFISKFNKENNYCLNGDQLPPLSVASFASMGLHNAWYAPSMYLTGYFESHPALAISGIFLPWISHIATKISETFHGRKEKLLKEKKTKLSEKK